MSLNVAAAERPLYAIALKLVSVFLFVVMSSCIKAVGELPAGQILFFRSLFGLIPLLAILIWRGQMLDGIRTSDPMGHILRGVIGVIALGLSFFALTRLPLAEAVSLSYAMPLFVVVMGAVVLHERVTPLQWGCVAMGLVGVAVISLPQLGVSSPATQGRLIGVAASLAAAGLAAVAALTVKSLVRTERSITIVVWFSITATAMSFFTVFSWVPMDGHALALLLVSGLLGSVAQIVMTESFRHAAASLTAPFEYSSVIFSIVFGYALFSDMPTVSMILGSLIVVTAGLMIGVSELRASRRTPCL